MSRPRRATPTARAHKATSGSNLPRAIELHNRLEQKQGNDLVNPVTRPALSAILALFAPGMARAMRSEDLSFVDRRLASPIGRALDKSEIATNLFQPHIEDTAHILSRLNDMAAQAPKYRTLYADPRASAVAVGAAEQAAKPRYALSENLRPGPSPNDARGRPGFLHHIYSGDQKIGSASGHIDGDKAFLSWIGASGQKNKLGQEGLSQLREEFRKLYPDVKTFEGFRSSGSRMGPAASPEARVKQSVTLPALTGLPLPHEQDDAAWLAEHYPPISLSP